MESSHADSNHLLSCLSTLSAQNLVEFFDCQLSCMATLQSLSPLARLYSLRLLAVRDAVSTAELERWVRRSSSAEHENALQQLLQIHVLQENGHRVQMQEAFQHNLAQALNDKQAAASLLPWQALPDTARQSAGSSGIARIAELERHARSSWSAVLLCLQSAFSFDLRRTPQSSARLDFDGTEGRIEKLLCDMGLLERLRGDFLDGVNRRTTSPVAGVGNCSSSRGLVPTAEGYDFLLREEHEQTWSFILRFARVNGNGVVSVLQMLCRLSFCDVGTPCEVERLNETETLLLDDLELIGLIWRNRNDHSRFFPTRLGVEVVFGLTRRQRAEAATAALERGTKRTRGVPPPPPSAPPPPPSALPPQPAAAKVDAVPMALVSATRSRQLLVRERRDPMLVIVETNFKVYAYTSSPQDRALLYIFAEIECVLPNFVAGRITREKMRWAFERQLAASSVLEFLESKAHPLCRQRRHELVPGNVTDQLLLWEEQHADYEELRVWEEEDAREQRRAKIKAGKLKSNRRAEDAMRQRRKQQEETVDGLDDKPTKDTMIRLLRPQSETGTMLTERAKNGEPFKFDFLKLKPDHASRPAWVCPSGDIYLEAFSENFLRARDFLVAAASPVSRPDVIHHYRLSPYTLFAASCINLDTDTVLKYLEILSKFELPDEVRRFVTECTRNFGKAHLVLERNRVFVESYFPDILRRLVANPTIAAARKHSQLADKSGFTLGEGPSTESGDGLEITKIDDSALAPVSAKGNGTTTTAVSVHSRLLRAEDEEERQEQDAFVERSLAGSNNKSVTDEARQRGKPLRFEIEAKQSQYVKEAAMDINLPVVEEYDFRKDVNPALPIELRASLRDYQERSISKIFGNGRARSGIIVLPCGAGKTLTGISCCNAIKRSCIVLCTGGVAVEQWIHQFEVFTTLDKSYIKRFTKDSADDLNVDGATLLVTTFSMMAVSDAKRSKNGKRLIKQIREREWGLVLLDEVHVAPATQFRKSLASVNAHCKIGLTATLVREDDLIDDLNFLVGPKLQVSSAEPYEADWMELTRAGFLANVFCAEVWCDMPRSFLDAYNAEPDVRRKELFYVMNPSKMSTCEMLAKYHVEQGHKILIFSDNIPALKQYSKLLNLGVGRRSNGGRGIHYMYGDTPQDEREQLFRRFRGTSKDKSEHINVLGISKVGDVAIDLPSANVIIQISSHFGSRRQEAQRLGRILRPDIAPGPKGRTPGSGVLPCNAFFYTLVSLRTAEMYYSNKRQQYLVDQGYTFHVIRDIARLAQRQGLTYHAIDEATSMQMLQALKGVEHEIDPEAKNADELDGVKEDGELIRWRNALHSGMNIDRGGVRRKRPGDGTSINRAKQLPKNKVFASFLSKRG